jgi:transposase
MGDSVLPKKQMIMSPYLGLYDILIPKNHLFRQINALIEFDFVTDELKDAYSKTMGAEAYDPEEMFKLLFLKVLDPMSDADLIERARTDMAYKYFLGIAPEAEVPHPTSLTKFRKLRLKDSAILDRLIGVTVTIAMEKGLIKSGRIIVDATHTTSPYHSKTPTEILVEESKKLRKAVYGIDENYQDKMPEKPKTEEFAEHVAYCRRLIETVRKDPTLEIHENVRLGTNYLEEILTDDLEELHSLQEREAQIGHKSVDTAFFGYKSHIAMTPERIITAVVASTGDKADGNFAQELIEKSVENGIKVDVLIGDGAYSGKENLKYGATHEIAMITPLNPSVYNGQENVRKCHGFSFNKDAGMYVCTAGHMAIRKAHNGGKKKKGEETQYITYFFDVEKCKKCPLRNGCYAEGAKTKSFSETIQSDLHQAHMVFAETEAFKQLYRERYKIEAKNAELKCVHGLDRCDSTGLLSMTLQTTMTIFAVNVKRIITLMNEKA